MKIALLTDSDVFAGTERHILDLAAALRSADIEVAVACPDLGILAARAREAGIPVIRVEKGGALDVHAIRALAAKLREGEIDLIHSHNGRTAFIAAMAVRVAGRGYTVATQHFTTPARVGRRGLKGWLGRLLHRWVSRHTHHVIAISDVVRQAILDRQEIPPQRVTMVWNGISDPTDQPLRNPSEVRAALQIPPQVPFIISAARLEPEKAVAVLIDAVAQLLPGFPEALCLVAGEGHQHADLEARIDMLGIGKSVRLIGYQPDVLSVVAAADVFVLPSPAEPFGLALVEAMALSAPVIATSAGGPLEIVQHEESGLLIPPGNPTALCAALTLILSDAAFAQDLGEKGRARFLRHFTSRRMAAEMISVYRRVGLTAPQSNFVGQTPTICEAESPTATSGRLP